MTSRVAIKVEQLHVGKKIVIHQTAAGGGHVQEEGTLDMQGQEVAFHVASGNLVELKEVDLDEGKVVKKTLTDHVSVED